MLNHKGTQTIYTERLILREIREEDYKDMYRYTVKEEVARYVSWTPHKSIEDTKALCKMWASEYKNADRYNWAIVLDKTVIGSIDVVNMTDTTAFLGWQLDSAYWNRGIMTEAASAVKDFLFNEVGADVICASCIDVNIASSRVMEKIGMKQISKDEYKKLLSYKEKENEVDELPVVCYFIKKEDSCKSI